MACVSMTTASADTAAASLASRREDTAAKPAARWARARASVALVMACAIVAAALFLRPFASRWTDTAANPAAKGWRLSGLSYWLGHCLCENGGGFWRGLAGRFLGCQASRNPRPGSALIIDTRLTLRLPSAMACRACGCQPGQRTRAASSASRRADTAIRPSLQKVTGSWVSVVLVMAWRTHIGGVAGDAAPPPWLPGESRPRKRLFARRDRTRASVVLVIASRIAVAASPASLASRRAPTAESPSARQQRVWVSVVGVMACVNAVAASPASLASKLTDNNRQLPYICFSG